MWRSIVVYEGAGVVLQWEGVLVLGMLLFFWCPCE